MLRTAIISFSISIIAGFLGFTGITISVAEFSRVIFYICTVLCILSLSIYYITKDNHTTKYINKK